MKRADNDNIASSVLFSFIIHGLAIVILAGGFAFLGIKGLKGGGSSGTSLAEVAEEPGYIEVSAVSITESFPDPIGTKHKEEATEDVKSEEPKTEKPTTDPQTDPTTDSNDDEDFSKFLSVREDSASLLVPVNNKTESSDESLDTDNSDGPENEKKEEGTKPEEALSASEGSAGSGTDIGAGNAGEENELTKYIGEVKSIIGKNTYYPEGARNKGFEGTVSVVFTVGVDGKVSGVKVVASSGADVLDLSAVTIVENSSPLPPPPDGELKLKLPLVFSMKTGN